MAQVSETELYVRLVSHIYEIASTTADPWNGLRTIKLLIDDHRNQGTMASPPFYTEQAAASKGGLQTPSLLLMDLTGSDTSPSPEYSSGDDNGTESSTDSIPARGNGDAKNKEPATATAPPAQVSNDQCEEFTLEEELEGIADAPVQERAAMRQAMQKREAAKTLWMRKWAEEKRLYAEKEGLRLLRSREKAVAHVASQAASQAAAAAAVAAAAAGPSAAPSSTSSAPSAVPAAAPKVGPTVKRPVFVTVLKKSTAAAPWATAPSWAPAATARAKAPGPASSTVSSPTPRAKSAPVPSTPALAPVPAAVPAAVSVQAPAPASKPIPAASAAPAPSAPAEESWIPIQARPAVSTSDISSPATPKRNRDDGDEEDEDGKSPVIISLSGSPPKNVHRFGVSFQPLTDKADDHRRSVLLQNLPHGLAMHDLLACIFGGTIVSAQLLPETASLGTGQTALLVFATASEARRCSETAAALVEKAAGRIWGAPILVTLLPSATYPTHESLVFAEGQEEFSREAQKQTRCLRIDKFPPKYINELCVELRLDIRHAPFKIQTLDELWFDDDEVLHICFTSIREAVKALATVRYFYFGKFSLQARFEADPCAAEAPSLDSFRSASLDHSGLRALMESVGLAAYARSHREEAEAERQAIDLMPIAPLVRKPKRTMGLNNYTRLAGYDVYFEITMPKPRKMVATPWTAAQMQGLELL